MELNGAQILLESLKKEGVNVLFGYPGGAIIDIYDELAGYPELHHILVRHEQAAVHAADGYARATGKVGCALVTSGPGATNTITGLATAYCDSIPLVLITGQVGTGLIGNDAFQEVDTVGITRPVTKYNYLVKDVTKLSKIIREAFYIARTGRPGPVLIDLPKDVQLARTEFTWSEEPVSMRSYNPNYRPNHNQLRKAVEAMYEASSPVILAGGGVILSNASEPLTKLAKDTHTPVACTLMGLGCFPTDSELWLGMVGMHGTYTANMALNNTDLIVCVGGRFDDRVTGKLSTFAPKAKVVHIDIDPTSIRKNVKVDVPVVADCRLAMEGMLDILRGKFAGEDWASRHVSWIETLSQWKHSQPLSWQPSETYLKPQQVVQKLCAITKGDAIICTEVGQNQMWAAQFYNHDKPRTFITSGGLGTMGYGLPAAMGAQIAFPDKLVVDIAGDGSIQMNIQEMATLVENNLPVKILILNNTYLGMVRQWQELFYKRNYSFTNMKGQPDFVKLAEAYGAEGYRIRTEAELEDTLKKALASPNPAIIDVVVEPEEDVYPMVPAGAALDEMLLV
ncbi:MAG: biosynthetic-type acetolactate synthase large subunit [Desulfovibrionaceae bacterium]|nr:biosynthetic-type acetolactate synthase large subunit [Desulfovibrionaceae bacterium]